MPTDRYKSLSPKSFDADGPIRDEAPVQVPAPVEETPAPPPEAKVTVTPGGNNDPHAGQGGAYHINEKGERVRDQ